MGGADNHYDALLALPTLEGLRLEAARFIVSSGKSAGADMLRMPANVLRLREAGVATYDILEPSWYSETLTNRSIFEITLLPWPRRRERHSHGQGIIGVQTL